MPVPDPLLGEADSQLPPLVVEALTFQLWGAPPPPGLLTSVVCGEGFVPPACPEKNSADGVIAIDGGRLSCSVTFAVAVPAPAWTVTVPL